MDYLILQGVGFDQLSFKGYGEEFPINECEDGVSCSQQNTLKIEE